jgi:hypothetical protein
MRDAESCKAATMEQVEINSDDEIFDQVIAAFKEDWKRKRQHNEQVQGYKRQPQQEVFA